MEEIKFEKIPKGIHDKVKTNKEEFVERFIDELEELFPETVKDGKVDFQALLERFGEYQDRNERYELTWVGKDKARQESFEDIVGKTLKYIEEDSKNPETTENLYIEGDNLEVLKLLRQSYYGKIKMIYIDPPYNTGNDFVYKDDFTMSKEEYDKLKGDVNEYGERLVKNSADSGRYHSNWLNMMYPRLQVARDLLTDDGIILVNIDEHEIVNLQKILIEIFGEKNDLGTIIWDKRNPKGDSKGISYQHEYIVCFVKNIDIFLVDANVKRVKKNASKILNKAKSVYNKIDNLYTLEDANKELSTWVNRQIDFSGGEKAYNKIDNNGDVYRPVSMAWPNKKKAPDDYFIPLIHPVTNKECPIPARGWRNPPTTMKELLDKELIIFGEDEKTQPNRKYLLKENMYENIPSLLYYGGSDTDLLKQLGIPFETPKVVDICKEHIQAFTQEGDIILDFFSGSSTIAHAVMKFNSEDKGNRKFIMVQLPEPTDEKSEAFKAGCKDIVEIGKERIRRAGDKILEDNKNKEGIENLDTGFKVFKVEDTNFRRIQEVENTNIDDKYKSLTEKDLEDFNPHFTDLDIVYELMLRRQDIELTEEIKKLDGIGDRTFIVGDTMLVCLEEKITEEIVEKIGKINTDLSWIILRDSAFDDDCDLKINTTRKLRSIIKSSKKKDQKIYWI